MHTLAAAQQLAVTSLSSTSLALKARASSSFNAASCATLFVGRGLRIRRNQANGNSTFRDGDHGNHNRVGGNIRSLASRKDRREMESGEDAEKFKPDIASLRSGFAKRFPTDSTQFSYDWDSDDEEDDAEVKSFAGRKNAPKEISRNAPSTSSQQQQDGFQRPMQRDRPREKGYQRWEPRVSRGSSDEIQSRRFTSDRERDNFRSSSTGPLSNRDAYERRMNGGKPGAPRSSSYESNSGQGARSNSGATGRADHAGAVNFRSSREVAANSTSARSSRDSVNQGDRRFDSAGSADGQPGPPGGQRPGRRVWVEEVEKKKKPVIEPVNFTSPMTKDPHVAILGGGMSGLVCALTLEEFGIQSTVFDTGKHGLGGRMGTRSVTERNGSRLEFDHAAQYFTVTDARFQKLVDRWVAEGAVKQWNGRVGTLQGGGKYLELLHSTKYTGIHGMRRLADHMVSQASRINVKRPCWISKMDAQDGRCWSLSENGKSQGEFDAVVIAHNGKCANRLLAPAGVPHVARQMKRLELSSIWALLAAFEEPLHTKGGDSFDGAFVSGVNSLSWMGNNSEKLGLDKKPQCWTLFSTAAYGKKNKVPQESIPVAKGQKVTRDMLLGVETALGLPENSLPAPIYTRLQLWGAALPTNTPSIPCIFDAQGRVGICGDWLLGSSLESAALSGMALAEHIAKFRDNSDQNLDFSVGLQQLYNKVEGHDIGQFPGTAELPTESSQEVLAIA